MKYCFIIIFLLCGCISDGTRDLSNNSRDSSNDNTIVHTQLYEKVTRLLPIYKKSNAKICRHKIDPIEESKRTLTVKGYTQLSKGIGIAIAGFVLSLFIANPVIQRFGNYGVIGGSTWAFIGLSKIFVATILTYIFWGILVIILFTALWVCRKRGIDNWIISKWGKKNEIPN